MTDPVEALAERVNGIGQKLDALAVSVDARFEAVDARFDGVDARFDEMTSALVEQRQYTEFAFDRLRSEMTSNFGRLERKLDQLIDRLTGPDA
jgi:hypothetical protein